MMRMYRKTDSEAITFEQTMAGGFPQLRIESWGVMLKHAIAV